MSSVRTVNKPVKVIVFAEYQLWSEHTATEWWDQIADEIREQQSVVEHAELKYNSIGPFGLQYLYFTAVFYVKPGTEKNIKKQCKKVVNRLVCDSDAEILNVMRINPRHRP